MSHLLLRSTTVSIARSTLDVICTLLIMKYDRYYTPTIKLFTPYHSKHTNYQYINDL